MQHGTHLGDIQTASSGVVLNLVRKTNLDQAKSALVRKFIKNWRNFDNNLVMPEAILLQTNIGLVQQLHKVKTMLRHGLAAVIFAAAAMAAAGPASAGESQMICTSESPIGSHIKVRSCRSAADIEADRADGQELLADGKQQSELNRAAEQLIPRPVKTGGC